MSGSLIGHLSARQIFGQQRECCASEAMDGARSYDGGSIKAYSPYVLTVPYVTADEMVVNGDRRSGKRLRKIIRHIPKWKCAWASPLYKEHDDAYYKEMY